MKKTLFLLLPFGLLSQNLEDAYGAHKNSFRFQQTDKVNDFTGEYQVFLDKLYWARDSKYEDAAKSLSIEVVSFPFIPTELSADDVNSAGLHNESDRVFDVQLMSNEYVYGELNQSGGGFNYSGRGWQYGNWKIYSRINNTLLCDGSPTFICSGDYGLISVGFVEDLYYANYADIWLPHTILKHTLYFHCGSEIDDPVIDSISWIYDDTRGSMSTYPFSENNGDDNLTLGPSVFDVLFRPTFINYDGFLTYLETTNDYFYESGHSDNTGSVNYFPAEEVKWQYNICENPLLPDVSLYYPPNNPGGAFYHNNSIPGTYSVDYVHPPPYVLLDAPLLNYTGNTWAGYGTSFADSMPGIKHEYQINEDFIDLRLINPVEKIIYNPSYVEVNADLVFPCNYKFLTLHGKYPDRENEVLAYYNSYWADKGVYFPYERDYPTPVWEYTNAKSLSVYEISSGNTILIEPNVIILDAIFIGNGKIAFDPDHKLGNWEYDENTLEVILLDYSEMDCDYFIKPQQDDSLKNGMNNHAQVEEAAIAEIDYLRIKGMSDAAVSFSINSSEDLNSTLFVYNAYGNMIIEKRNPGKEYMLNTSLLPGGVYIAVLLINGEKSESLKFIIK